MPLPLYRSVTIISLRMLFLNIPYCYGHSDSIKQTDRGKQTDFHSKMVILLKLQKCLPNPYRRFIDEYFVSVTISIFYRQMKIFTV